VINRFIPNCLSIPNRHHHSHRARSGGGRPTKQWRQLQTNPPKSTLPSPTPSIQNASRTQQRRIAPFERDRSRRRLSHVGHERRFSHGGLADFEEKPDRGGRRRQSLQRGGEREHETSRKLGFVVETFYGQQSTRIQSLSRSVGRRGEPIVEQAGQCRARGGLSTPTTTLFRRQPLRKCHEVA
jgi:hypothetical protein